MVCEAFPDWLYSGRGRVQAVLSGCLHTSIPRRAETYRRSESFQVTRDAAVSVGTMSSLMMRIFRSLPEFPEERKSLRRPPAGDTPRVWKPDYFRDGPGAAAVDVNRILSNTPTLFIQLGAGPEQGD